MPVKLGAKPEHSFDQPLGLLSDCHRRIENFLSILSKVVEQAHSGILNDEQRRAVETALEYFRSAAPRHTADEEESLFPLLRACNKPEMHQALEAVDALEHDHQKADQAHAQIDQLFRQWLEKNQLDQAQVTKLSGLLTELKQLYQHHIAVEDQQIFPLAGKVLNNEQLAEVGRQMAQRRGLTVKQ